jgi:arginine:ornithine antiporter / lysine permease
MVASESGQKLSLFALTEIVVGSMVGAGIFSLPRTFAGATGPVGAVIAWLIACTGIFMLALVSQSLAERRPDIEPGVLPQLLLCLGNPTTGASTDAC